MSAAGGAYPIVPPLPALETRRTVAGPSTGLDTTTTTLSDEQKGALAEGEQAAQGAVPVINAERVQGQGAATAESEQLDRQQAINDWEAQQQQSPQMVAIQQYIDRTRQHTRDEESKLAGMPSPALFADRQGWDKAKLAIGLLGASLGAGMVAAAHIRLGMAAPQDHTVDNIIERDLQRQRDAIAKQSDAVVKARTGEKDAEDARQMLMADINLRGQQMYKRAELVYRSRLARLKYDQAQIDADQKIVDLKNRQAEKKLDYVKSHSNVVQSKWDSAKTTTEVINRVEGPNAGKGGGVEADKNAANFALFKQHGEWLAQNLPGLTKEEAEAINRVQALGVVAADSPKVNAVLAEVGVDPESGSSGKVKAYLDHMSRANDAIGRLKSGGAINKDEDVRFSGWFKPRPSDSPEDRSMRAQNITGDIDTMGQFLSRTPKAAPGAPATTAAPAPSAPATPTRSIGPSAPARDPKLTDPKAIAQMRAVLGDKRRPAKDRDAARAFLKAAKEAERGQ